MSTQNISAMIPDSQGGTVVFQLRNGSTRSYHYNQEDFAQIASGADPRGFESDGSGASSAAGIGVDILEGLSEL